MTGFTRIVGTDVSKDMFCAFYRDTELIKSPPDRAGQVIVNQPKAVNGPLEERSRLLNMKCGSCRTHMCVLSCAG